MPDQPHVLRQPNVDIIHRLPNELLSEVFLHGLSSATNLEVHGYLVVLLAVCKLWRGRALSTRHLWTHIVWEYDDIARSSQARRARLAWLVACLARSGTFAITMRLNFGMESHSIHLPIWKTVTPHLSRCTSLVFAVPPGRDARPYLPLHGPLASLKQLQLDTSSYEGSRALKLLKRESVPSLCYLDIRGDLSWPSQMLASVPLAQLENLKLQIHGDLLQDVLALLSQCTALAQLKLNITDLYLPEDLQVVTLPRLRSLHISDDTIFAFRQYLSAPALEELCIDRGDWNMDSRHTMRWVPGLISDSLQSLTIRSFRKLQLGGFFPVLTANPSITSLTISRWDEIGVVVDTLAVGETQMLPNLACLMVDCFTIGGIDRFQWRLARLLKDRPKLHLVLVEEKSRP